jgi:hypothetical protein
MNQIQMSSNFHLVYHLSATAANGATSETLSTLLVALRHWTLMLVYLYTALGGLMLSYMLLRTRLVPGGLFEFLLPIWLFAKGFNLTASDSMRVARVSG